NLETFQTHIFSADTTPKFFVEDAVRITMSLPGIFKPFVLKQQSDLDLVAPGIAKNLIEGVYVDGGLLNNIPLHFFDTQPGDNPKTLGLRLKLEERNSINSFGNFIVEWPCRLGVFGSGEAQLSVTAEPFDNCVILDTRPLDLLDFEPDKEKLRKVI